MILMFLKFTPMKKLYFKRLPVLSVYIPVNVMKSRLLCGTVMKTHIHHNTCPSKNLMIINAFHSFRHNSDNRIMKSLTQYKRLFALVLFSGTLLIAWIIKNKKVKRMKKIMEDVIKIQLNEELFKSKVSLYKYQGFNFPGDIMMSGVFEDLSSFEFSKDDIVVASFPKAGTTWVQEIVYMLTHGCQESGDSTDVLETRFPYLEYPYPGIKSISKLKGPRLIKTHLPFSLLPESFTSSGAKVIYIMRNPRDTAVSYWHFMKLLTVINFVGSFREFVQLFISDRVPYSPFYEHIRSYLSLNSDNIIIIQYEELKENPFAVVRRIAEFLQIPLEDSEVLKVVSSTSFEKMLENKSVNYEHWKDLGFANLDGRFLRRGKIGDWRNHFTPDLLEKFIDWEKKKGDDLKFKYEE